MSDNSTSVRDKINDYLFGVQVVLLFFRAQTHQEGPKTFYLLGLGLWARRVPMADGSTTGRLVEV